MLSIYEYNGSLAGNLLEDMDVINALTSSDTTKPLSAAQGKALNDKINKLGNFKVIGVGAFQLLYSNANLLTATAQIEIDTLNRIEDMCFLTLEGVTGTPYNQISSLSYSYSGNTLIAKATGQGFVSGHVCRCSYLIIREVGV